MLELENISARYGAIRALEGVSLTVPAGQVVCLLGANGAGKTTTLNCISGVVPLAGGRIRFEGEDVARPLDRQARRARHRAGAGGPRDFSRAVASPTICCSGSLAASAQAGGGCARARLRLFPAPEGARRAACRHAVGRRAADADDRTRADGAAEALAARRAEPRPLAGADRAGVRDRQAHPCRRRADPAGRAERARRARREPVRLRAGERRDPPARRGGESWPRTRRSAPRIWVDRSS